MYSIIKNVQCNNQCVDLLDANPTGPIGGHQFNCDSKNQTWTFFVVDPSNRLFYFQNAATLTYATVDGGASSVVGGNEYTWKLKPVSIPAPAYQIMTPDESYMWRLTGCNNYDKIVLVESTYAGEDAQWTYEASPCFK